MKFSERYPVWFPYPSSWIRGLALVLIGFPLSLPIFFGYLFLVISFVDKPSILLLVLAILCLALAISIFSCIYYFFGYKKFSKRTKRFFWSVWEGFFATFVLATSFALLLTIISPIIQAECKLIYPNYTSSEIEICVAKKAGKFSGKMISSATFIFHNNSDQGIINRNENNNYSIKPWAFIWFILAVYLHQIEYLFLHKFIAKLELKIFKNFNRNKQIKKSECIKLETPKHQVSKTEISNPKLIKTKQDEVNEELEELKKKMDLD